MDDIAICIASGPSVTQSDIDYCKGKGRVYVVNEMVFMAPWAHVHYAADFNWWDAYRGCPQYHGPKFCPCERTCAKWGLTHIPVDHDLIWGENGVLATGGNSGFQILNLAVMMGAKKVVLLGYDMGHEPAGPKHCFDDDMPPLVVRSSQYDKWIKHFEKAAPLIPVPVFNASPSSNLNCFKKVNLREII